MNDQMEQVWRSKDGVCVGSQEEVEAYLETLNPLGKMRFPYRAMNEFFMPEAEAEALVAFANLAPDIEKMRQTWDEQWPDWKAAELKFWAPHHLAAVQLLLAYEEALKEVPQ